MVKFEQLDIYYFLNLEQIYKVGQAVRVRKVYEHELENDLETYYYLLDLQNQKGQIVDIITNDKVTAYKVKIKDKEAILKNDELIAI